VSLVLKPVVIDWLKLYCRWFDKSFSLILTKDGTAGINFEHSWGDGVAVLRYFTDMFKDSTNQPQIHPETKPSGFDAAGHVRKLGRIALYCFDLPELIKFFVEDFKLNDSIKNSISEAKKRHMAISKSLGFDVLEMQNYGKKLCKKHKVSPDAIMQLGFQVKDHKLLAFQVLIRNLWIK
jgi:carnitine O-palmitoyltransferase 2